MHQFNLGSQEKYILGVGLAKYLTPKAGVAKRSHIYYRESGDILGVGLAKCTPRVGYQVSTNNIEGVRRHTGSRVAKKYTKGRLPSLHQ